MSELFDKLKRAGMNLLVQREGPLTRELLQEPSKYGLGRVPSRLIPDATTTMTCGFCSTGCGLEVLLQKGEAVGLKPATDHPVNIGMACPKGWEALAPLRGPGRALKPMLRRDGKLTPVSWEDGIFEMVDRFKEIQEKHGPASVAWIGTGQLPSEELAFLGALGKFGMGMIHGDGNTRQCMATSVVA
jgi:anaerobic selenocysteine-containing dehydrogenase